MSVPQKKIETVAELEQALRALNAASVRAAFFEGGVSLSADSAPGAHLAVASGENLEEAANRLVLRLTVLAGPKVG